MTIEAMKQALEALEVCEQSDYGRNWVWPATAHPTAMGNVRDAITALRTAIAEAEKQEHATAIETCPYDTSPATDYWIEGWQACAAREQAEKQEPVAVYHGGCTIDCGEHGHHNMEMLKMIPAGSKLYTTPPAAQPDDEAADCPRCGHCCPQRQPLTDEQWQIMADTLDCAITRSQKNVIEAALGIGEKT